MLGWERCIWLTCSSLDELSGKWLGLTTYLELLSFLVIKTKSMYE